MNLIKILLDVDRFPLFEKLKFNRTLQEEIMDLIFGGNGGNLAPVTNGGASQLVTFYYGGGLYGIMIGSQNFGNTSGNAISANIPADGYWTLQELGTNIVPGYHFVITHMKAQIGSTTITITTNPDVIFQCNQQVKFDAIASGSWIDKFALVIKSN